MTRRSDPNPAYWEQYGPFQHVKHELIRCYLNGWYPKLGTWAGRVLYVDTHAGRGRYESGDPGSPVLALQTLLRHSYREKLLKKGGAITADEVPGRRFGAAANPVLRLAKQQK